jgi:fluoroquinolone transport system permease protein
MKKSLIAFKPFIQEIMQDTMLTVCLWVPILAGSVFKFLIPFLEQLLCNYLHQATFLSPYYLIFDLLLALLAPMMFAFPGTMVILGEFDNSTAKYLSVTPLGRNGYIMSRLGIPTIIAIFYTMVVLLIFSLTTITIPMLISLSVSSGLMGLIPSLLVVSFARNKVEGMAMNKFASVIMLGIFVPFFIDGKEQYLASFLPSFWFAQLAITHNYFLQIPLTTIMLLWIYLLWRKFERKIM